MTNLTVFNQDKASELFNSTERFPVSFDDAWRWLEYDTKGNGKRYLLANLEEGIDFIKNQELGTLAVPRPSEQISLSIEGFKNWAMMSKTEVGKQVRKYFIECERVAKYNNQQPKTRRQLAQENLDMIIELEEKEEQLTLANNQIEALSEVVDELFSYSSILRIAKFNNVSEKAFGWHKLKAASKALNLEIKSAPCPRYGTKNLYHHAAWQYIYPEMQMPEDTSLVLG